MGIQKRLSFTECYNYTSMVWIQNVYYVKINLCIQRNVYKMSEKIFATKSFKVLFYSITAVLDFISLNIISCLMYPKTGTINLQPWIK